MKILMKGGAEHEITPIDLRMLQESFPGVDVAAECRAMAAWCRANPGRRKTARGIHRFINAWLLRAKESGSRPKGNFAAAHKPFAADEDLCKTSAEDKRLGELQLARMQAMIEARNGKRTESTGEQGSSNGELPL